MAIRKNFIKNIVLFPFVLCVMFLNILGRCFGMSYKRISVVFNLYIQGAILLVSGCLPFFSSVYRCFVDLHWTNIIVALSAFIYSILYIAGFYWFIRYYHGDTEMVFYRCVSDLNRIARYWHMSYMAVNLVIFIFLWLGLVVFNCYTAVVLL